MLPPSPTDLRGRIDNAVAMVATNVILDACKSANVSTLNAQFDEIPKGFHIVSTFGMCIVVAMMALLRDEGYDIDQKAVSLRVVSALLVLRSDEEKFEQYQLGHTLLTRFTTSGSFFTKLVNDLTQLTRMYLLAQGNPELRWFDYPSLFGSALKTMISVVELPL